MTNDEFAELVHKLEREAQRNPAGYQRKVLALAVLGNVYLGTILLLLLVVSAALIASLAVLKALGVKLLVVVVPFFWLVLKSMRVKLDPPAGFELHAAQAPELFALIEDLRRRLQSVRFHHVLITEDFNAAVVQNPRLGVFGWQSNYLLLGLPLLQALTIEQLTAVLAHEMGHLSRGHGRVANWIYRQRRRWQQLLGLLEARGSAGGFLFKPFFERYAPHFQASSFPLARANEYEADATSARLTTPRAAAEALTGVNVVGAYLERRFWPEVHRQADEQPSPGFAPFHEFGHRVTVALDAASAQGWLDEALARDTDLVDTHPALRERLQAIGESARLALPTPGQSATRLLGALVPAIVAQFDKNWQSLITPSWEARYRTVQQGRQQLADLDARRTGGEQLSIDEGCTRARLTNEFRRDADAALVQLRVLHEEAPGHAEVCYHLGALLLERNDESGCTYLEQAMAHDEDAIAPGAELLRDFHWRIGRKDEARSWHERLRGRLQLQEAAAKERDVVRLNDAFEPHGLEEGAVAALRAKLVEIPELTGAYLVRKLVKSLPQRPLYVLGFTVTRRFQWHSKQRAHAAMEAIRKTNRFPGETLIVNLEGDNKAFLRKIQQIAGARLLRL